MNKRRQENNIRMDLTETGWEGVDWMHLTQDRDRSCEHGNEPSDSIQRRGIS